ncbi:MAG: AGE family epimerase/isomerase [Gemmatimonadota bacterium]
MTLPMPTLEELEGVLRRHVLDAWFPRCIDHEEGGFLCDFDRRWSSSGPHDKLLEFQARQTLTAADAFRLYPEDQRLRDAALHGFNYLRDAMWDGDAGGWFHRLDRAGRPLEAHTKHAHGAAYAIEACVAVHEATGSSQALDLAREGFAWLEHCSRDPRHGGYYGFLQRDGTVIREASRCPWPAATDTIGTEIGLKDANVHSDLLETFVQLFHVWPDPKVGERLEEVLEIVSAKMVVRESGALQIFVTADWVPVPHLVRTGYQFQTAYRLTLARGVVGDADTLRSLACHMLEHGLRYARDPRGGYFYGVPGTYPLLLYGRDLRVRSKSWWVQAEALKALFAVSRLAPERIRYAEEFQQQWTYLSRDFLDERHGGFYASGLDTLGRRRLLGPGVAPRHVTAKGDAWKDASHDGRALMYCIESLRNGGKAPNGRSRPPRPEPG